MEGSLVAYKVFTNGSVLQASEINDNLMRQSVMVFSNAAARTAAITVPLEGMLTWLEDVNAYQFYNGTAWVSAAVGTGAGLVHIVSQTVTSATSIIFNNCFSSSFSDYKISVMGRMATRGYVFVRLRAGGVDASGSNYLNSFIYRDSLGLGSGYGAATAMQIAYGETQNTSASMEITQPFTTQRTSFSSRSGSVDSTGATVFTFGGGQQLTTAYDGLNFIPDFAFTGTISIYGIRA
jgi:hypothetical protein